jgi:arginine N-succinyltransferase
MNSTGVVIRPAALSDLESLHALALSAGLGMTNLPPCRERLLGLLNASAAALAGNRKAGSQILLVMEARGEGGAEVVGTGCIFPSVGGDWPFYSYRIGRLRQTSQALGKVVENTILTPVNDYDGSAEVGGLFVRPGLRGMAGGRLMARSRYLFMAEHRDWFGDRVVSELRGYQDEDGRSPFWEAVGRKFYGLEFKEADRISVGAGKQVIADLGPKYPIYLNLLPTDAAVSVGQFHPDGARAHALLTEEGFRFEGCIDIFDAGPTMVADIDNLKAVRDSRVGTIGEIGPCEDGPEVLACAGAVENFRASRGQIWVRDDDLRVSPELAAALNVQVGDVIRHVEF